MQTTATEPFPVNYIYLLRMQAPRQISRERKEWKTEKDRIKDGARKKTRKTRRGRRAIDKRAIGAYGCYNVARCYSTKKPCVAM